MVKFFGQGHTKDNVVGYFPIENILFGGCLIKELEATKGYLGDANVGSWSNTVEKIKKQYPKTILLNPPPLCFSGVSRSLAAVKKVCPLLFY